MPFKKLFGKFIIVLKLLQESALFAFSQLRGDKFRTFLSLFGVSIGIFSIVAVFTAIDALDVNAKRGLNTLGGDIVQISIWPMDPSSEEDANKGGDNLNDEYKWWEYMRRPSISITEYKYLVQNAKTMSACAFTSLFNKTVKYERNSIDYCAIGAVSYDWEKIANSVLEEGRYFTSEEMSYGRNLGILGYEVSQQLFGDESPIGKKINIMGRDIIIIGKYAKQGESIVNVFNSDEFLIIPYTFGHYFIDVNNAELSIFAKPKEGISQSDFADELTSLMRAVRRLRPGENNDFSINKMTFVLNAVNSIFKSINIVGWIIAGFSLLIGGFGIANIMFVSVKERTNIIGIQKALGAKKYVILSQFLIESAFLSFIGGIIGVILVAFVIFVVPNNEQFTLTLSSDNVISGLIIACVIGIISGVAPAYKAANLNPVDAINYH
jgi:ABC-type antimicrobial peptide transport system, permease component